MPICDNTYRVAVVGTVTYLQESGTPLSEIKSFSVEEFADQERKFSYKVGKLTLVAHVRIADATIENCDNAYCAKSTRLAITRALRMAHPDHFGGHDVELRRVKWL